MIQRLGLKKLLSFIDTEVKLRSLNVLIGAAAVQLSVRLGVCR
jgi:predicted ATPase